MSKILFKKELILIDFKLNEFTFYNVEILSVGFKEVQLITNYGKLGNKGKENIIRLNDLKEAYKIAYKRIYDKKEIGYISKSKLSEAITAAASFIRHDEKDKKIFNESKNIKKEKICDLCEKDIPEKTYEKINQWARNEGNWDQKNKYTNGKVICIDCQIEKDIFKKKLL